MSDPFAGPDAAVGGTLGPNSRLCVCGHPVGDHLGPAAPCRALVRASAPPRACPCGSFSASPFQIGTRVEHRHGPGTVAALVPDAAGRGRPALLEIRADSGQAWMADPADATLLGPDAIIEP